MKKARTTQDEVVMELLLWENVKKSQHPDDCSGGLLMLTRDIRERATRSGGLFSFKKEEIDYQALERMLIKEIEERKEHIALVDTKMQKLQSTMANGSHAERLSYVRGKDKMLPLTESLLRHRPREFEENVLASYRFYTKLELAEQARSIRVSESIITYLEKIQDAIEK